VFKSLAKIVMMCHRRQLKYVCTRVYICSLAACLFRQY